MASKYRKTYSRVWDDEKFQRFNRDEKLTMLYLLSSPQSNRAGLYRLSPALAAEHLGVPAAKVVKLIRSVVSALGWAFDEGARVLWIDSWWKYNPPENERHMKGCLSDLSDLPATPLLDRFMANTEGLPDYAAVAIAEIPMALGIGYPSDTQADGYAISGAGAGAGAGAGTPKAPAPDPEEGFEEFWISFPRKVAKPDALKAWAQVREQRPPLPDLLQRLGVLKRTNGWTKDGGQFVPYPATWLRRHGWNDEPGPVGPIGPTRFAGSNVDPATIALLDEETR